MKELFKDGFDNTVRSFRDAVRHSAERPAEFWVDQREGIMARLKHPASASTFPRGLLLVPAAIAILLCVFLFRREDRAPVPDFAAGADQDLLVDVERALGRDYAEALAPADVLVEAMR